ncbi:MAG: 50S ribosomal protein L10 [Pseudomonadota bacterium]|uniref:Large ribosomal subunit protein uL10 n=1 Tax=Candidatus Desulfatibia profunda TaxID=2841695 RepID=A0A8J6TM08_9BACT|nr:50S ribosomal protein L10 [Candidatus Desulfatibia profunda]MBL7180573.1 50S ribosomal protein L10 [Desulfobacterales bacterium]
MKLEEKKKIVEDLQQRFLKSKVVIVTDYKGLDVTTINDLRKKLREFNVEYKVVKNTLLVRASAETDVALIKDSFKGPSAVALGYDDPVAPAKVLKEFADKNKALEIKIGVMKGRVLDLDAIRALSSLPSREVLLAQLLAAIGGVPANFVRTLAAVPARFLNVLAAIKEQKEAT